MVHMFPPTAFSAFTIAVPVLNSTPNARTANRRNQARGGEYRRGRLRFCSLLS